MSEWITDRRPEISDADINSEVWVTTEGRTHIKHWKYVYSGDPWMPTNRPAPYVKPGRFRVVENVNTFSVNEGNDPIAISIPTREAAERIADVYNEVMP